MKTRFAARAGALAVLAILATACGNRDLSSYEPGVYKGATDPLLAAHGTAEHHELLRQRLAKVQAER